MHRSQKGKKEWTRFTAAQQQGCRCGANKKYDLFIRGGGERNDIFRFLSLFRKIAFTHMMMDTRRAKNWVYLE